MQPDDVKAFLESNKRAVLATHQGDGGIQMSPVLVVLDGEGRVTISSRETAYKVKNLRADPRATVCVLSDAFFGKWIYVEGEAEIVSLPEAMELLVDYYRRGVGEHEDWDDYRSAMEKEQRLLIRFPIEKWGPTKAG